MVSTWYGTQGISHIKLLKTLSYSSFPIFALSYFGNLLVNGSLYEPLELRPGIEITDNEQLAIEAGKFANTIFHPVSTCRMGNDENAVVSDKLKVHGLENLRIIDASVMPYITSGNTNAPTIMIAEKGADLILNS